MNILIVDDDAAIRKVMDVSFSAAGHAARTAASGAEALELVKNVRFDAVVLDVEMPTMSGWKVLEAIHATTAGAGLPVILFTAHENPSSDAYAKMLGAYALLRKPVSGETILQVIRRAVGEKAGA